MYLMHKPSGDLVEILNLDKLFSPIEREVNGRFLAVGKLQVPAAFRKDDLVFTSGETLPRCWINPTFRDKRHAIGG